MTLPWQLGATQSQLLTWTKEVYGRILYDFSEKGALINFVKLALKGEASLEQCRKLANIVHHYSHALEFSTAASTTASKAKNEKMEAGLLRLLTYHVLVENVVVLRDTVLRKHQNTSSTATTNTLTTEDYHNIQFPADYPELVKQVVIAGQQMLLEHSQSWEGIHHKEELVELYFPNLPQQIQTVLLDALQRYAKASNMIKEMEVFLQEMLMTSNPKQHHAIYHMIAHMHLQQAERIIHNPTSLQDASMLQEALDHAEESVRISRMLIRYSGHQILIQPLMLLANLLSMLQQLPKAYVIFEEALNILQPSAERSAAYSKAHDIIDFLLPLTLNYGMALVEGRQYGKGRQRLQEAQRLLQLVAQGEGHEPHPQQAMLDLYQQKVNDFLHIASSH